MRFARTITLAAPSAGIVEGWVEDNFHHFGVRIEHDGSRLVDLEAEAVRYPWTTCAAATGVLRQLVGQPLTNLPHELSARVAMSEHCTHMFELAALVLAQAARGGSRRYDVAVEEREPTEGEDALQFAATLAQDRRPVLAWSVSEETIVEPADWDGQHIVVGFRQRLAGLDPEAAEQAWVLRRGVWLARGDRLFQEKPVAADVGLGPVCYTYQPERAVRAFAMAGSRNSARDEP